MTYVVQLAAEAEEGRRGAYEYYAERSQAGAARWFDAYQRLVEVLRQDPHRFARAREAEDLGIDLREALFGTRPTRPTHRLLFVIHVDTVRVLAVRHHAQQDWTGS